MKSLVLSGLYPGKFQMLPSDMVKCNLIGFVQHSPLRPQPQPQIAACWCRVVRKTEVPNMHWQQYTKGNSKHRYILEKISVGRGTAISSKQLRNV